MEWNDTPPQREGILFLAVLTTLFLFLIQFHFSLKSGSQATRRARLEALIIERDALAKFLKNTPHIPKVRPTDSLEESKLKAFKEQGAPYQDLPSLLSHLTTPAFLKGTRLEGFSFQPEKIDQKIVQTDFILQASGTFGGVVQYLRRLETFPALFQVADIILSRSEERGGGIKGEISCRFYRIIKEPPG